VSAATDTAYAKINLALHVRARRSDGYHDLETLFAFAEDGDILSVEPAESLTLRITGPFSRGLSSGADNLVMRAARALQAVFNIGHGASLHLEKQIPVASGIGGGSADAAAAIRLLATLWGIDVADRGVMKIAGGLGADIPACLASVTQFGTGVGEMLQPVTAGGLSRMPVLLINPGMPLGTGPVFNGWDGTDHGPLAKGDPLTAALAGRNDLTAAAVGLIPEIELLLNALAMQKDVLLSRMSGSGATCFALFRSQPARDRAAAAMKQAFPRAWCLASRLR
jgi:4-diphosphocytidyl-2-C-methyl-D-erythritol kinase